MDFIRPGLEKNPDLSGFSKNLLLNNFFALHNGIIGLNFFLNADKNPDGYPI